MIIMMKTVTESLEWEMSRVKWAEGDACLMLERQIAPRSTAGRKSSNSSVYGDIMHITL